MGAQKYHGNGLDILFCIDIHIDKARHALITQRRILSDQEKDEDHDVYVCDWR